MKFAKIMFLHLSVILFTRGGGRAWQGACVVVGVCRGVCVAGGHAWQIPRDTVNERAVRILLECILVTLYSL